MDMLAGCSVFGKPRDTSYPDENILILPDLPPDLTRSYHYII